MTKKDQEEHRLAALAAGIKAEYRPELDCFVRWNQSESHEVGFWGSWIPLSYSSDSFDLMVSAEIVYDPIHKWVSARLPSGEYINISFAGFGTAQEAIFRCAVEIGMAKEQGK